MREKRAAAHRRKNKRQFTPLLYRAFSHAHGHFCVLRLSPKGLRKKRVSAGMVGYKITSFL